MNNKIICRKCGGEHLTIKCGKDAPVLIVDKEPIVTPSHNDKQHEPKLYKPEPEIDKQTFDRKDYRQKPRNYDKSKLSTVKLSDLPLDTTEPELYELLQDWGHIVKVKVLSYNECNVAYIDFIYNEEAVYFIEAIDKTPFDRFIISAELCVNRN
jgi:RNA recognition motif-containing protein